VYRLKIVDLFSGIGGFSYAAEQIVGGFETIAFVEQDDYCQKVLRKHWHDVPIYSDIRSFNAKEYKDADIVVGGFPCQPWSVAGSQRGSEDDRDLWHEMVRVIEDIRPRWIIGENVSGFVTMPMGLRRSLIDLESIGYKAIPYLIPAAAVDAKHRRMRCWIVGHTEHDGSSTTTFRGGNNQVNGGSTQRQNQTSELEGASRRTDDEFVQTDIFDLMADTYSSNGGNRADDENIGDKRGDSSKAGRESLQSENRQTRSSNFESSSQSLANTDNTRDRTPASGVNTEQQTLEQGRADISQSEPSRQRENVPNTEGKRLERRIHSPSVSSKGNESTHSGNICSRERINVADTYNKGVRTRINGSDDDIQEKSGERRVNRTTSRTDVGSDAKTTKNGEMGLSQKGDVPYTISKRGCSGSTRGEDAKNVRQSSFRERPVLWNAEPNVGRVANGVSNRVHRLRCLGNSIVPQVVARIFFAIKEADKTDEEIR
jgi:DNA-cytosine methyltransferase